MRPSSAPRARSVLAAAAAAAAALAPLLVQPAGACPIVEWQQEVRNNWLCSGGCWDQEWCRHGCSHTMHWDIPRGYYIARAWLTAASYGGLETVSGYADYEMAEAHHDLEGTESYGERRYGGERGGWFDETNNARGHENTDPEQVRTYVDARAVAERCTATEPREWNATESLLEDGFPSARDYTSHTYTTPNKTLESYDTVPEVRRAPTAVPRHSSPRSAGLSPAACVFLCALAGAGLGGRAQLVGHVRRPGGNHRRERPRPAAPARTERMSGPPRLASSAALPLRPAEPHCCSALLRLSLRSCRHGPARGWR